MTPAYKGTSGEAAAAVLRKFGEKLTAAVLYRTGDVYTVTRGSVVDVPKDAVLLASVRQPRRIWKLAP